MRPGPGLVVMALAFISGARRGSTSTSTSSKISATSYSTSSTATIATPIQTQSTLVAIVTPPTSSISTYLANLPVPHFVPTFPDQNLSKTDKRKQLSEEKHRQRHSDSDTNSNSNSNINSHSGNGGLGGGSGGGLSTIRNLRKRKKTYDFQQSDNFKLSLFELPTHFQRFYDQTQTSRDRRSISAFLKPDQTINLAASTGEDDIIVERTHKDTSYESSSSLSSSSSSLPASSTEELDTNNFEAGLTVQYAQPAADPSNSFEEDDILGLVEGEEHSLISEESFDRLQKLTPSKISNANEEDYSEGIDSYSSTHSGSGSGSGGDSQSYSETTEEKVGNNYKTTSVGSFAIISDTQLLGEQKSKLKLKLKKESEQLPVAEQSVQPEQELKNYYVANLVSDKPNLISSNRIATLSWSLVEENNVKRNTVNISDKRNLELPKKSIIESASPLTRLNPWISACDLAQPGTAPDLQGQCSASALPVAWVDEGPGPPICPESCAQRKRLKTKRSVNVINFNINKNYDNKFNENQLPYIKSNNYYNNNNNDNDNDHVDHKNNNNYKNNNNNNKKSLSSNNNKNNNKYDEKINNNKQNRQQITKHMSNKVRRNAAVKTEVSSANIAQIQRTTTTTRTRTATTEQNTGTTMSMTMTTPLSTTTTTTTTTSTTSTVTETATTETQTETETETEPEISTQETKNAKNSTEATKQRNRLTMSNKWIGESQQPQQHVTNVTTILNNNNNDNAAHDDDNKDNGDDDIVNKTNSNEEQQQYIQHSYDEELKYSYLLQPDEHNLDEYDSNKKEKLNGNDKFKLLHDEQVERQQQYQQEPEELNDDVEPEMKKREEEMMDDLEMEKTQCLDYLGDSLETSPLHLCSLKSPGQLVSRLRTLRLRHCCERNVFSALHTIALNATLSGGVECVRILMDIIDLDALATRITCEYAEILFRFDCRQVYSLIHQCHDCKEAYRRWVCSTLVPYFAEPSDVITPIFNTTATTSNNHNNNNNNNNNINNKKLQSNIIYDHKGNMTSKRSKRNTNKNCLHQKRISLFENVLDYYTNNNNKSTTNNKLMNHNSITQKANYSISTANNDPCSQTDSVISKVHRRTKRHIQFRRRKRIRPCLSVCQTVEQLCPYLLPADRAPAMPTQYAGEPTFLCLDLNIPEVTEQEESSINGRPDCCYTYCGNVESGICVQCDAFAWSVLHSIDALTGPNTTKPVQHNVTLTANAANALSARISIALRNDSDDTAVSQRAMESLSYYAYYDGIYYYDDELQDMPYQAISGNCETVPSVTGRCTVPYYAVAAAAPPVAGPNQRQSSMLWASLMAWCLYHVYVTTCHRLKYQRKYSNNNTELNSKSCQHWEIRSAEEATSRSSSSSSSRCNSSSNRWANTLHRFKRTPQNSNKLYRYSKGHIKNYYCRAYILSLFRKKTGIQSQITIKSFIQNNTLTYKSCKKINNNFLHISSRSKNNSKRNKYTFYKFQLFHYINFNINDWWRRWCEFTSTIFYL